MRRLFLFGLFLAGLVCAPRVSADSLTLVAGCGSGVASEGAAARAVRLDGYANRLSGSGYLYTTEDSFWDSMPGVGFIRISPEGVVDKVFLLPQIPEGTFVDDLEVDSAGNVYLAAHGQCVVYRITPAGEVSIYAGNGSREISGDGGPATAAGISKPESLSIDHEGNLYIAHYGDASGPDRIRRVDRASGIISTVYSGPCKASLYVDRIGQLFFYGDGAIKKLTLGGEVSTVTPVDGEVYGITGDAWGNIFFSMNRRITRIDPDGSTTKLIEDGEGGYARISMDTDGMLFITQFFPFVTRIYRLAFAPQIRSISPAEGPAGTKLVLDGRYFQSRGKGGTVLFDTVPATIVSWTNENVICTVPRLNPGLRDVVVIAPDGQMSNIGRFNVTLP